MVTTSRLLAIFGRVLLYAVLAVLVLIVVYPLAWMILSGFRTNTEIFSDPFGLPRIWHWGNYVDAWNRGVSTYLAMSVVVTVTSTVLTVMLSAWAAYALSRIRVPLGNLFLGLILGGLMLAPSVALIPLVRMMQAWGLYNTVWALVLLDTAFRVPFTTFLIRAYMVDLPREVDEAARIDGADQWQTFWRVILPMSKPIVISAIVLQVLFAWNEYLFAKIFTTAENVQTLPIGLTSLMSRFGTQFPVVFAGMVIAALPVILIFLVFQRQLVRGLTEGIGK